MVLTACPRRTGGDSGGGRTPLRVVANAPKRDRERPCQLVLSSQRLYVLMDRHVGGLAPGPLDDPYKNLHVAHSGALKALVAVEIGLDRQTILMRFQVRRGARLSRWAATLRRCPLTAPSAMTMA